MIYPNMVAYQPYYHYPASSYYYQQPQPVSVTSSQYHAQDEFGNLQYGYNNINSVKHEVGNTYGGVTGGYSYVDPTGALQTVQYVADDQGFRVADTRLPTFTPEPLKAPEDTKEVVEAREAHMKAWEAALMAANENEM